MVGMTVRRDQPPVASQLLQRIRSVSQADVPAEQDPHQRCLWAVQSSRWHCPGQDFLLGVMPVWKTLGQGLPDPCCSQDPKHKHRGFLSIPPR